MIKLSWKMFHRGHEKPLSCLFFLYSLVMDTETELLGGEVGMGGN